MTMEMTVGKRTENFWRSKKKEGATRKKGKGKEGG